MSEIPRPKLWDKSLRKALKPEEKAELDLWFSNHPGQKEIWEEDRMVTQWIKALPPVEVSSNFTSMVVDRLSKEQEVEVQFQSPWYMRIPKLLHMHGAVVCLLTITCLTLYYIQNVRMERTEVANHVAALSRGLMAVENVSEKNIIAPKESKASLPPLDILENFDAINRLTELPAEMDAGLLVALE